jgi:FkbM family methyltransferase
LNRKQPRAYKGTSVHLSPGAAIVFISYAQNFEDVILWRALKHVKEGFYIDIGAQDPISDSVSRAFHEQGWRGIHVEPAKSYAGALRRVYTDNAVVQAMVGEFLGESEFFEIEGTGLSTADSILARRHQSMGKQVQVHSVSVVTLASILEKHKQQEIHWLKIDVEGFEASVIRSWTPSEVRPWVVVVECVDPISLQDTSQVWEAELCALGYQLVYRDGLNRFYLSNKQAALKPAFEIGPNIFDGFSLSGTSSSSFCAVQSNKLAEQAAHEVQLKLKTELLLSEKKNLETLIERLNEKIVTREEEFGKQIAALTAVEDRLQTEIRQLAAENHALARGFVSRIFFRDSGKPIWPIRRLLFHADRSPRSLFKRIVLRKNGHPRKLFRKWLVANPNHRTSSGSLVKQERPLNLKLIEFPRENANAALQTEMIKWRQGKRIHA